MAKEPVHSPTDTFPTCHSVDVVMQRGTNNGDLQVNVLSPWIPHLLIHLVFYRSVNVVLSHLSSYVLVTLADVLKFAVELDCEIVLTAKSSQCMVFLFTKLW